MTTMQEPVKGKLARRSRGQETDNGELVCFKLGMNSQQQHGKPRPGSTPSTSLGPGPSGRWGAARGHQEAQLTAGCWPRRQCGLEKAHKVLRVETLS